MQIENKAKLYEAIQKDIIWFLKNDYAFCSEPSFDQNGFPVCIILKHRENIVQYKIKTSDSKIVLKKSYFISDGLEVRNLCNKENVYQTPYEGCLWCTKNEIFPDGYKMYSKVEDIEVRKPALKVVKRKGPREITFEGMQFGYRRMCNAFYGTHCKECKQCGRACDINRNQSNEENARIYNGLKTLINTSKTFKMNWFGT